MSLARYNCIEVLNLYGGKLIEIPSFNLSITNHLGKKMTGPYHAIAHWEKICKEHFMSKFDTNLYSQREMQPLFCKRVKGLIVANDPEAVLYSSRTLQTNESVFCHLGEVYLRKDAKGTINECLTLS